MVRTIKFNVEAGVKIPQKNGKYLMFKNGKFKSAIFAEKSDDYCRIYEDYDSAPIQHSCFKDCLFYYIKHT